MTREDLAKKAGCTAMDAAPQPSAQPGVAAAEELRPQCPKHNRKGKKRRWWRSGAHACEHSGAHRGVSGVAPIRERDASVLPLAPLISQDWCGGAP